MFKIVVVFVVAARVLIGRIVAIAPVVDVEIPKT